MLEWYQSLSVLELVYFYIAAAATLFLIVQIVMMIFSFAGASDLDGDGVPDGIDGDIDNGLSLFTVKGLTAFFAVGGWTGLALFSALPDSLWIGIAVSVVAGLLAMTVVALVMKAITKLQCDGTIQKDKLVGQSGTVYVTIKPQRESRGKITLTAQGRYMEMDAVTDSSDVLNYGESVVIDSIENDTAVVSKK